MKKQLTRFSIYQTSKVLSLLAFIPYAIFCFTVGVFTILAGDPQKGAILFVVPFVLVIFYFIFNVIFLWFYNVVARIFGGIEFDIKDIE